MKQDKIHVISAIVEHKPGVLYRVSNMFRCRNFNIESITVGKTEQTVEEVPLARMTITVRGDNETVEQVTKQMNKLIDVIKVSILNPKKAVSRELALLKVNTSDDRTRSNVIKYVEIFKGHVVDVAHQSLIVEITGDSDKINAFIDLLKTFGIKEISRTGITALERGKKSMQI